MGFFLVKVEGDDITVFSLREFDKAVNGDKVFRTNVLFVGIVATVLHL